MVSENLKSKLVDLLSAAMEYTNKSAGGNEKYFELVLKILGDFNHSSYIFDPGAIRRINDQPQILFGYVYDAWIKAGRPRGRNEGTAFVVINDCHMVEAVQFLRPDDACVFEIKGPHCVPSSAFWHAFPDKWEEWTNQGSRVLQKAVAEEMGFDQLT